MLTEGHLFLPFPMLCYPQGLSYNVGHFGPTFARSKGPYLGPDFGVQHKIHGQSQWSA